MIEAQLGFKKRPKHIFRTFFYKKMFSYICRFYKISGKPNGGSLWHIP